MNNREIAACVWIVAFLTWALTQKDVRRASAAVVRAALHPMVFGSALAMAAWVAGEAAVGAHIGVWNTDLLKDTAIWFAGVALGLLANVAAVTDRDGFFRRNALRAVGITVFIEFYVNFFVLPLPVELLLIPTVTFLVGMSVVSEGKPGLEPARKLVNGVVHWIGLGLFAYVGFRVVTGWSKIDWKATGEAVALPIWLTLALLPFIYVVGVFSGYQLAFMRIDQATADRHARARAKLALLVKVRAAARDLGTFRQYEANELVGAPSFRDARAVIAKMKNAREEELRFERDREERLEQYAGVDGTDEQGRRLDQREFDETKEALDWIATCQSGWRSNPNGRYRDDLIAMLEPFPGLPNDHGFHLRVSRNGKSWWAWRRTVSGWCLGLGATGSTPDEWVYDGPEPPKGPPSKHAGWTDRWAFAAPNWDSSTADWVEDELAEVG